MALVKCPECGRERVSDTAEACPDCGYNVREHYERVEEENKKKLEEDKIIEKEKALEEKRILEKERASEKEKASKEGIVSEKQKEQTEGSRYLENGLQIQQKDSVILYVLGIITILLLVGIVYYTNLKANNSEEQKYCYLPFIEIGQYSSGQEFLSAILECKERQKELDNTIKKDFKYDEKRCSKLQKVLINNYEKRIEEIVNTYNGSLEYSIADIRKSIENDTISYTIIGRYYAEGDFGYCFYEYLQYFSKTYAEDCSYYIVKTLYPETFSEGIKELLAKAGSRVWGDNGKEMLNEVITYINSTPEGGDAYASLIADARKQLDEKNKEAGENTRSSSRKKKPAIGMTAEEVLESTWGRPQKINKTTYSWGVTEQWCYSGYRYIYFENGTVSSISE